MTVNILVGIFFVDVLSPFLCIGVMHTDLSSCGKYPWAKHLLHFFDNMGDISLMLSFKTECEILLRPAPLSFNYL